MDHITKAALVLIAAGLWANAIATIVRPAQAASEQTVWLGRMALELQSMSHDFHDLVMGSPDCKNPNLCR